ncbi:hypothetical protein [Amycolatopsis sp. PS_44_ISF1]|nr:hypothetical protein [Amycolatopsis sp. PS_44_ISF1]MDT8910780.1 hypothetical protein [Amycolatopsis sp. PS_44_ISF1]
MLSELQNDLGQARIIANVKAPSDEYAKNKITVAEQEAHDAVKKKGDF